MKKAICVSVLSALLFVMMIAPGVSAAATTPKIITHYEFADASNLGKDTAGKQDLRVIGKSINDAGTAKQVAGPDGKKALEFDQTYALISDAADSTDNLKEFTITYLVSANDSGILRSNVFSTGLGNGNFQTRAGINHLIDRGAADGTGVPDFRLMGGDASASTVDGKWDPNQRKNDDGKNAKNFWSGILNYDAENNIVNNIKTYKANEWHRVVIVVKLSDGTKSSESTMLWPNNNESEAFFPGTGFQSMYMDKVGAIKTKKDFVKSVNYYTTPLPFKLTSIRNDVFGLMIGAAYNMGADTIVAIDGNVNNYARFIGKMADFRIYDKAFTEDQVAEMFATGEIKGSGVGTVPPTTKTTAGKTTKTTAATASGDDTSTTAPVESETDPTETEGSTDPTEPESSEDTPDASTTTATAANTYVDNNDDGGLSTGVLIGIIVGAVAVLAGIAAAIYFLIIKKKK